MFPRGHFLIKRPIKATVERCGAVVKRRTRDREVPGSIPTDCKCCFLEQETLSTLLSTGLYPGKKRATWKISTRLLNVLPSINKVDYYYYYYYYVLIITYSKELWYCYLAIYQFHIDIHVHVFIDHILLMYIQSKKT